MSARCTNLLWSDLVSAVNANFNAFVSAMRIEYEGVADRA